MAPPPSTVVSPAVALAVRALTFVCLLISLIVLTTNTATLSANFGEVKIRFKDIKAYRYMLSTIVIGIAYTLLQTAFTIYETTTGNRIGGNGLYYFDFYGDKFMSYMLATGVGAGFGVSTDLKEASSGIDPSINKFFDKANAASGVLLVGFLFTAISSIFSSLSLPKRGF